MIEGTKITRQDMNINNSRTKYQIKREKWAEDLRNRKNDLPLKKFYSFEIHIRGRIVS